VDISGRDLIRFSIPTYQVPALPKVSAGYFTEPHLDLVDLFVGSEGTLGVITGATLRVKRRPLRCVALIVCSSDAQAIAVAARLRADAAAAATPPRVAALSTL